MAGTVVVGVGTTMVDGGTTKVDGAGMAVDEAGMRVVVGIVEDGTIERGAVDDFDRK